jgi:hypothetical protein
MRAKVNQGTAQVKIRQDAGAINPYREGPVVDVGDTSWTLYNMGTCKFPLRDVHAIPTAMYAASYDQYDSFAIWARVKPGSPSTPTLDMDCLVLVPCDEYFIHIKTANAPAWGGAWNGETRVCVAPEDVASGATVDVTNSRFNNACAVATIGSGVPNGTAARAIIVGASADSGTAPVLPADADVAISVFPRWIYARGAE